MRWDNLRTQGLIYCTLAVLIASFAVSYKTPRPSLRVYLGFSICPSSFSFHFVLVLFLHFQPNQFCDIENVYWCQMKGRNKKKRLVGSCLRVGHCPEEKFCLVPDITKKKNPAQNSAQLVNAKAKWLESVAIHGFTIKRWEIGAL